MKNGFFILWRIFLVTTYWRKAIIADRGVSWVGPTSIDRVREEAERGRRTICFKVQWLSTAVSIAATGAIDIWTGTRVTRHAPPFRNIIILCCAVAPQPKLAFSPPHHPLPVFLVSQMRCFAFAPYTLLLHNTVGFWSVMGRNQYEL